jgi:hypothetical protein
VQEEYWNAARRAGFFVGDVEAGGADVSGVAGHDIALLQVATAPAGRVQGIVMASNFPWEDEPDDIACNFALGDLVNNLQRRLTVDGRIHADTLIASVGAIAGFAAQRALFAQLAESGDQGMKREIQIVTTTSGAKYYFGEPLNRALVPASDADAPLKLWSLAAGAAVASGLSASDLPKLEDMFAHVSETLGGEREGLPSLPENRPHMPARELLKLFWPLAMMCFKGELSGAIAKSGEVSQRWRPVIAAYTANSLMQKVRSVLAPTKALVIVMESAIYASKLDTADIETAQF